MQQISEATADSPPERRDRGNAATAVDPEAKEAGEGRRYPDLAKASDRAETGRKRYELEPDIGPDRGE